MSESEFIPPPIVPNARTRKPAPLAPGWSALAVPLAVTYVETGLVPRLPTAVLATGLGLLSSLSLTCGLILENVTHTRQEARRLIYLGIPCSGLPGTVGASVGSQD